LRATQSVGYKKTSTGSGQRATQSVGYKKTSTGSGQRAAQSVEYNSAFPNGGLQLGIPFNSLHQWVVLAKIQDWVQNKPTRLYKE